jgi:hypothetical protein
MLSLFVSISCNDDQVFIREEAKKEFELKVNAFIKEHEDQCKKEAIDQAETFVDSLIARMGIQPLAEEEYQPEIPGKPEYVPVDSSVFRAREKIRPITEKKIE